MKKNIEKKDKSPSAKKYAQFLDHIKEDIQQTQLRAALAITKELTLLYWRIGKELSKKVEIEGWGTKVVDRLAIDLASAFPGVTGFSIRNLRYMRKFAETYPDLNFAAAAAKLPWGHNMILLDQLNNNEQRLWYAQKSLENGWSRSLLSMWIESDLYKKQGRAITNFKRTLPDLHSDLAHQTLKDPYNFDFLTTLEQAREKDIEEGLTKHIQKFLLELGQGFSFVGRQYHLIVGSKDIYIDMLFYHIKLRCFIVVELKAEAFDARDLGQINLYLTAVDRLLKHPEDRPTIGLLLCRSKDNYYAEYALQDINKPIGISSYTTKLVESLPKELRGSLPTIAEIEAELEKQDVPKLKKEQSIKKKRVSRKISTKK